MPGQPGPTKSYGTWQTCLRVAPTLPNVTCHTIAMDVYHGCSLATLRPTSYLHTTKPELKLFLPLHLPSLFRFLPWLTLANQVLPV